MYNFANQGKYALWFLGKALLVLAFLMLFALATFLFSRIAMADEAAIKQCNAQVEQSESSALKANLSSAKFSDVVALLESAKELCAQDKAAEAQEKLKAANKAISGE